MMCFVSCKTPQPVVPLRYSPVVVDSSIKNTTKSLNDATLSAKSALENTNKLVQQVKDLQSNVASKVTLDDIRQTASEDLFNIQQTFTTLDTKLKNDLFDLQTKSLIIQNQVQSLSVTVEELSKEKSDLTKKVTETNLRLSDETTSAYRWMWIGGGSLLLILITIALKIFSMFSGSGAVVSIINKIL